MRRRRLAAAALTLGLPVVALSATADALPGLGGVSVNRAPVSVNRTPSVPAAPSLGSAPAQRDPAADRRAATRQRRRQLVQRWSGVAECESGGNWQTNTGNGYYGGLQFSLSTWQAYGGRGRPDRQPAWYQAGIADRVRQQSGLHHWPNCGQYYG
jgi:hypothetical protein